MNHIADRFTATLDANVLYPFLVRDVLLCFAEAGLYRPVWSRDIQNEWSSSLIEKKPERKQQILRTVELMEQGFPEAMIGGYEDLLPGLVLPDPNDRHVLAVAIVSGSSVIVAENSKHFPRETLAKFRIEPRTADEFIVETFELYKSPALERLRLMREGYNRPSMTAEEFLVSLTAAGLVSLAAELKEHLTSL